MTFIKGMITDYGKVHKFWLQKHVWLLWKYCLPSNEQRIFCVVQFAFQKLKWIATSWHAHSADAPVTREFLRHTRRETWQHGNSLLHCSAGKAPSAGRLSRHRIPSQKKVGVAPNQSGTASSEFGKLPSSKNVSQVFSPSHLRIFQKTHHHLGDPPAAPVLWLQAPECWRFASRGALGTRDHWK